MTSNPKPSRQIADDDHSRKKFESAVERAKKILA